MITIIHILIALASIGAATYAFIRPSNVALRVSYIFIAATLMSGTVLVVSAPAHMIQACTSGLVYTIIVVTASSVARQKLIQLTNQN